MSVQPDFVIAYPKTINLSIFLSKNAKTGYLSYRYFTHLFARRSNRQNQTLIIKYLQTCLKEVTKSGKTTFIQYRVKPSIVL